MELIDLVHELALIENITRADLTLSRGVPARNDFQEGYDKHVVYVADVLGLVKYDLLTGEYV